MSRCKYVKTENYWDRGVWACGEASCPHCGKIEWKSMPVHAEDCSCEYDVVGFLVVQTRNPRCLDHGDCLCRCVADEERNEAWLYSKDCPKRDHIPRARRQTKADEEYFRRFRYGY